MTDTHSSTDIPTPPALAQYEIDWSLAGYLGAGSYGTLYQGIDKETRRPVALKFICVSNVFDHLVLRETVLLSYLAHVTAGNQPFKNPSIDLLSNHKLELTQDTEKLPFMRYFPDASAIICLVTPLYPHDCEKFRTHNLVSDFTLSQMVFFWYSLVTCIRNLHRLGVVHRDIKPSNILLDSNGSAFLADFGMAKYCMYTSSSACGDFPEVNGIAAAVYSPVATGTTCTLVYRAPESVFRCYDFLAANVSMFTRSEWVQPVSLDALGDIYALALILLESIVSRVVFYLPLEPKNTSTSDQNASNPDSKSHKIDRTGKQDYYLVRMRMLLIKTYRSHIYELFLSFCKICGYNLSPNHSMDNFKECVNNYLQSLFADVSTADDDLKAFVAHMKDFLDKEGPNLSNLILSCIQIRFGTETGRESELAEFAKGIASCLTLSVDKRATSVQLYNAKLFKGDKAHAQYVLGDCSTLGAGSSQLKISYENLCSCLGTSKFLQNLRRYLPPGGIEEIAKQLQTRVQLASSLFLVLEDADIVTRVANSQQAKMRAVKT